MERQSIFAVVLILIFTGGPAMGAEGEVNVSAIAIDCANPEKETNILTSGGQARIWINVPATTSTVGLTYTIADQGTPIVNSTTFSITGCGDGYFFGDIPLPTREGTVTLSVKNSDDADIGSDSFQLQ